jgi:AbrB family looped-hinge helix DNA binding protein
MEKLSDCLAIYGVERTKYIYSKINLTAGEMMDIAITRMSSKGQVVIPSEMREGIEEGDKLLLIKNDSQIILKKASELDKQLQEDITFAKRTDEALKKYDKGEFKTVTADDFLKMLEKC